MLREEVKKGTELGNELNELMKEGKMVPQVCIFILTDYYFFFNIFLSYFNKNILIKIYLILYLNNRILY